MKFFEEEQNVAIILEKGEKIIESIKEVAKNLNLSGCFTGIGALAWAELAYGDAKTGKYSTERFTEGYELLSLIGNVTRDENGEVIVHCHVVLSDRNHNVIGGHLVEGEVSITSEIFFNKIKTTLMRRKLEGTDFKLIFSEG